MLSEHAKDHAPLYAINAHGVPWAVILQWLRTYGFQLVLQVLPLILSGGAAGLSVQQIITWVQAALIAIQSGAAPPPIPTPAPVP